MQPIYDPDHGELRCLVNQLTALDADMIASDLRALQIPAVGRQQVLTIQDPDTGEESTQVAADLFEIVVPDAFFEISREVLDATHMRREGDVSDAEIEEELLAGAPDDPLRTDPLELDLQDNALLAGGIGSNLASPESPESPPASEPPRNVRNALLAVGFLLVGAAIVVLIFQR